MLIQAYDVQAFRRLAGDQLPEAPIAPNGVDIARIKNCRQLIHEEVNKELFKALDENNMVEIADAIIDSIYVLIFLALELGIQPHTLKELWDEVAITNIDKVRNGCIRAPGGKILKPAGWRPPRIKEILDAAVQDYTARQGGGTTQSPAQGSGS